MRTLTITSKMSNSGSIHDMASDMCDRDIEFRGSAKFAVVLSAYYGGKGYTTHKTERAAAATARANHEYSLMILDCNGNRYDEYYGELILVGQMNEAHETN